MCHLLCGHIHPLPKNYGSSDFDNSDLTFFLSQFLTVESVKKPPGEGERAVTRMTACVQLHLNLTLLQCMLHLLLPPTFKLVPPFLTFKRPPHWPLSNSVHFDLVSNFEYKFYVSASEIFFGIDQYAKNINADQGEKWQSERYFL